MANVRIRHRNTGTLLADGPVGWGITPFEGNFYIRKKYVRTDGFRVNWIPGLCPYKFLYVWLDFYIDDERQSRSLGWLYWLPNPILPFTWFRVAVPRRHPDIDVEEY